MSIETMKQALEALDCIYSPLHVREINKVGAAMKVLRQAIEQAEKQEPVAVCEYCEKERPVIHAPAAPVQNPVAWVADGILMKIGIPEKYTGYLYTTPQPQREWVGLTDEEMKKVHTETGITYLVPADYDHHLFTHITDLQIMKVSRAIEAKLKEKNNVS